MKTIAHISDPHFGRDLPDVGAGLLAELNGPDRPTLIAISGDLTQRARSSQFQEARAFLDQLTAPYLVVPGNHDIPIYDVFRRFLDPLGRYKHHVSSNTTPFYEDDEMVVCGMNTAHGHTFKDGRVRPDELAVVCAQFALHPKRWKVLVAHHPFVIPNQVADRHLVDGAAEAIERLEEVSVDLILTGHLHVSYARDADAAGFRNKDHSILGVNAGTCISSRHRGEPNSYNRLAISGDVITIVNRIWDGTQFVDGPEKAYRHGRGSERLIKIAETATPAPSTTRA